MPYLDTAESWLTQSALLLKARPTTTRITTKYTINPPIKRSKLKSLKKQATAAASAATTSGPPTTEPKATGPTVLVLKTYDPVSGATLKYKTDKAADVGRLIASLGRLGRHMAALPETTEVVMDDVPEVVEESAVQTPPVTDNKATPVVAAAKSGGGGGASTGKKGKKKGKK